jgi:uncharacterized iron-regulated membrane protein
LHKVAGAYGFVMLLVLALSGVVLEIPDYVNPLIGWFSPLQAPPKPQSILPAAMRPAIALDEAVSIAQGQFPRAEVRWIETPGDATGSYRINLRQAGEPSRRFPKTNVWIDQYSGNVLRVSDPVAFSAGDTLVQWLHPLHSGEAFDMPGRLLVLATGLVCPLLFVTGVLRWRQKRRARRQCGGAGKRGS